MANIEPTKKKELPKFQLLCLVGCSFPVGYIPILIASIRFCNWRQSSHFEFFSTWKQLFSDISSVLGLALFNFQDHLFAKTPKLYKRQKRRNLSPDDSYLFYILSLTKLSSLQPMFSFLALSHFLTSSQHFVTELIHLILAQIHKSLPSLSMHKCLFENHFSFGDKDNHLGYPSF